MGTVNTTTTYREENETGLSGSRAVSAENVQKPDQVISAGTEEQTALALIKDHQLLSMSLLCDQDAVAQFLSQRYAITASVAGPPGTITTAGDDLTEVVFPGDLVRIEGSAGDDGVFVVATVTAAPNLITLENGQDLPAGGSDGTVARVASAQLIGYRYPILATVLGTGAITYTGNVTDKFAAGEALIIQATVANDGYWIIDSVIFAAGVTTIIVNGGTLPATEGVVGHFVKISAGYALAAGIPLFWELASGLQNPFIQTTIAVLNQHPVFTAARGDLAFLMVTVAGTTNGNFDARLATNAIL